MKPSTQRPRVRACASVWRFLALALALWHGAASGHADDGARYASLPGAKALAIAPGSSGRIRGEAHGAPHDLAASLTAMARCEAANTGKACELIRLNDEHITTGGEILSRLPPDPHPLYLWRFQNADTTVFLAGSIHILKPTLYPLPAPLERAFSRSDHLVLEVDLDRYSDHYIQQQTLHRAMLPGSQTLADVLPPALQRQLAQRLPAYGLSSDAVQRATPALVMNQLVVARLMALGYLPDFGVEKHFLAQRGERAVLELESLDDQLELLFGQPLETQVQLLSEALELEMQVEPLLASMLTAWLAGDDARFLELFKAQSGDSPLSQAFTRALLDDRNVGMTERIRDLLDGEGTYFVLVGAAHLVGDRGIVNLLGRQGIRGQRIQSTDTL